MIKQEMDKQKVILGMIMDDDLDNLSDRLCTTLYQAMKTESMEDCERAVDVVLEERGYTIDELLKALFVYKASVELHIMLKEEALV